MSNIDARERMIVALDLPGIEAARDMVQSLEGAARFFKIGLTLQLAPGVETRVGLGLWRSPGATLAVEAAMFAAGVALYARTRPARDRAGTWGFWSFVALLVIAYAASLSSATPPSPDAVGALALVGWALLPWIAWFDRHRGVAWQA